MFFEFKVRSSIFFAFGLLGLTSAQAADLVSAAPPPVIAPAPNYFGGFYLGSRQMLGGLEETKFRTGGGATEFKSSYDLARYSGAMLGYSFSPVLGVITPRVELEASFGGLSVDTHTVTSLGVARAVNKTDSFGDLETVTGMFNGYLDANLGGLIGSQPGSMLWRIQPYVGAGIGFTRATFKRQGESATGVVMDDTDTRMTWQASIGLGYKVFHNTTVEVGFRHQQTDKLSFVSRDGTTSETKLANNLVTLGMRRQF